MSKTLLITGANRGIGFEMAWQPAMTRNQVIACARNIKKASKLVVLANDHASITLYSLVVTNQNNMEQIATSMQRKVDILVCNASALNSFGSLEDEAHHSHAIETVLMANIAGVFFTARSFLPTLLKNAEESDHQSSTCGKIAIISSIMGSQERAGSNAPIY